MNNHFRIKAVALRKKGLSYSEIERSVPVSRSTLSLWLRNILLSKQQTNRIAQKRLVGSKAGAAARHKYQVEETEFIAGKASKEIGPISQRELWLLGIALYWAEGAKQKVTNISQGVVFSNSDPNMVRLFLIWLRQSLNVPTTDLVAEVYLHQDQMDKTQVIQAYWLKVLNATRVKSVKIYFKKTLYSHKKYNNQYKGLLRIKVRRSTILNRKIAGWISGIYWGIV